MEDCNSVELTSSEGGFYPGYEFNLNNDDNILDSTLSDNYVRNNIESNIGAGVEKINILNHERCYLQGNLYDGNQVYTGNNFYKSSSMIEDLNLYATTGDPKNGNVCGQGHYIYTDINPSTGETIEE